ncbi:MAG: hypothetical protein AAFQ15_16405 [Pseudomonadota bacterium]
MDVQVIVGLIAFLAAFIGSLVSLLSLLLAKEAKTSEFRQYWINELREQTSSMLAGAYSLSFLYANKERPEDQISEAAHTLYVSNMSSILLRLNPNEKSAVDRAKIEAFESHLREMRDAIDSSNYSKVNELGKLIIDTLRPILKTEWDRVKRGELTFRVSKYVGGFILVLSLSALLVAGIWGVASVLSSEASSSIEVARLILQNITSA